MEMPRGAPTRAIAVRIDERLAASLEERAAREGKSLSEYLRAVAEGTFRYPGRLYTWAESAEKKKLERQVEMWKRRATEASGARGIHLTVSE